MNSELIDKLLSKYINIDIISNKIKVKEKVSLSKYQVLKLMDSCTHGNVIVFDFLTTKC